MGVGEAIGGVPPYTFTWSTGADGNNVPLGNFTEPVTLTVTDSLGCAKDFTLFPNAVGIELFNNNHSKHIKVYPNPSKNGLFSVSFPDNIEYTALQISIYDLAGHMLTSLPDLKPIESNMSLNLNMLNSGYYILKCTAYGNTYVSKIAVLH